MSTNTTGDAMINAAPWKLLRLASALLTETKMQMHFIEQNMRRP